MHEVDMDPSQRSECAEKGGRQAVHTLSPHQCRTGKAGARSISPGPGQGSSAGPSDRSRDNHLHSVSRAGCWFRFYAIS